ncbi:D-alanyl-D-alanine carboxypeptidase family protein [Crassaminicella profunda]|uniref:D-alanyl-D-alanine carboxypeptidase family protein n=1 Tax=Crassaminicella profunda TaxID=1286698 RepID=UPI001CA79EA5|nr:D-alanyl-D-alanine carboxypeptidase family protein [Crassaminicella profunda]QZY57073.1 D-alanyl-D-alanine carboxypeptidase [Crassaminicella profunda]
MKKLTLFFIIVFTLINTTFSTTFAFFSPPPITAPSGILMDAATGDVLYNKNAYTKMYPASTTKIMTALLVLEHANLEDKVIIDKDTPFTEGTRIYVMEDEEFTVEQLLYALLIESANDAAVALAKHVSGSVEEFAKLMNKRAKELGAKNTHFVNPNGLPDDNHYTTSYDLAMIAKYAMTIPKFREIVKTIRYQIPPTNKQIETRYFKNKNRFLWSTNKILYKEKWIPIKYDIVEGIKTGYTSVARQCLVALAKKDGHSFITVVLKAEGKNLWVDSRTLIDYGFENFKFIQLTDAKIKTKSIPIKNSEEKQLDLLTQNKFYKAIPKDQNLPTINKTITYNKDIKAPIKKGQVLGKVTFNFGQRKLGEVNLIAAKSIPAKKGITSIFYFNNSWVKSIFCYIFIFILLFLVWRTIITMIRLKKKKRKLLRKKRLKKYSTDYMSLKKHPYRK